MNPTMLIAALLSLLICSVLPLSTFALLFPQQNEIRSLDSLDGLWTFVREPANSPGFGFSNNWANLELASFPNATQLPVPAAFNELTADGELREHVGWVWYQRDYWLPEAQLLQKGRRSMLRFGSVQYNAVVFVNGREVGRHTGGHLPFEIELGLSQGYNSITVAVNNTLSNETIPPGDLKFYNLSTGDVVRQKPNFDFFNYAGILRPVQVWHLPQAHISAIKIIADSMGWLSQNYIISSIVYSISGEISYRVDIDYGQVPAALTATNVLIFFKKSAVAKMTGNQNWTRIENAQLWWPRGMGRPNLYTMQISLHSVATGTLVDVYRETFGFRTISIREKQILLNGRPFYCHGFGMHEDFEVHGRGFDRAVMTKDLNMLEWMNGNCYRTSHYPYSEERAYEADRRGIAVITEVPAVGLRIYNRTLEKLHARMITEMVIRDRNHPSVIMWSLANEPEVHGNAQDYFKDLAILTKHLDSTRPVTVVFGSKTDRQIATDLDVVCVNYYFGWYSDLGFLPAIEEHLANTLSLLQQKIQKPLILSEYGADTVAGLHEEPGQPFTEQYQVELIRETAKALDRLRKGGQVVGEMIWNFADFMTAQDLTRMLGNHKGVLTRDRKPKMAAYTIKERYKHLMEETEAANGQHREL